MIDSNLFLAKLTILILVNHIPLGIEIWSQLTIGHSVNYEEFRIDNRFKIILSPVIYFDSSQSCMIEIRDLIISWAQSTISQSTILHKE